MRALSGGIAGSGSGGLGAERRVAGEQSAMGGNLDVGTADSVAQSVHGCEIPQTACEAPTTLMDAAPAAGPMIQWP
jgi:hypothetical protein